MHCAARSLRDLNNLVAYLGDERFIDGGLDLGSSRIGNFRSRARKLLVNVVFDLGLGEIAAEDADEVFAEVLGEDERCVIFARINAVHGFIF